MNLEFEPKKPQDKESRVVYDSTKNRKGKEAQVEIEAKEAEKPIEKPIEAKPEEEKPAEAKEKPKKTYNRQPKEMKYPLGLFINAYGFIRIPNDVRLDLGWGQNGNIVNLVAEKNADGSLTIRKALDYKSRSIIGKQVKPIVDQ